MSAASELSKPAVQYRYCVRGSLASELSKPAVQYRYCVRGSNHSGVIIKFIKWLNIIFKNINKLRNAPITVT